MAWKRGVQNNQMGAIQKGHIREFLLPSSRSTSVSTTLKVLSFKDTIFSGDDHSDDVHAYISDVGHGFPDLFLPFVNTNAIYLHAHEHPKSVITAILHPAVPTGCIALNDVHLVNSKVCTGEQYIWTVYQGEYYKYDAREGIVGDTALRSLGNNIPILSRIMVCIRRRQGAHNDRDTMESLVLNGSELSSIISKKLFMNILTNDEIFVLRYPPSGEQLVCRIAELESESSATEEIEEETESSAVATNALDDYRGLFVGGTRVYLSLENSMQALQILDISTRPPALQRGRDIVDIRTNDDEIFPVLRRILRPCISLTPIVQAGYGKYKNVKEDKKSEPIAVDVDSCTFDRILLYLEHAARNEAFSFDPLLAADLLTGATILGLPGLQEICLKVLGNFQERVRRSPIRFEEICQKNDAGTLHAVTSPTQQRSSTWLILDGMVLDVSRWLDEHPGGSTIIPEQALNKDCTLFFEIYHASRQSFLYLKEFYVGELHHDDLTLLKLSSGASSPSTAFLEELKRHTTWRLRPEDMVPVKDVHKSF